MRVILIKYWHLIIRISKNNKYYIQVMKYALMFKLLIHSMKITCFVHNQQLVPYNYHKYQVLVIFSKLKLLSNIIYIVTLGIE